MAPLNVSKKQEQTLRKLATDEQARTKARDAFAAVTSEAANLDVLERCKRLNEFLSQDYAGMDKGKRRDELQHMLELLTAKTTCRPSILDKPSPLTAASTASKGTKNVPGKPLPDPIAVGPKLTSNLAEGEALQLLTLLEEAEASQAGSRVPAAQHSACGSVGSSRPGSSASDSAASASQCSSSHDTAEDDLIAFLNPTATPVGRPGSRNNNNTTVSPATSSTQAAASSRGAPQVEDRTSAARAAGASKVRELQQRMLQAQVSGTAPTQSLKLQLSTTTPADNQAMAAPHSPAMCLDSVPSAVPVVREAAGQSADELAQRVAEEAARREARIAEAATAAAAEAARQHAAEQEAKRREAQAAAKAALEAKRRKEEEELALRRKQEEQAAAEAARQKAEAQAKALAEAARRQAEEQTRALAEAARKAQQEREEQRRLQQLWEQAVIVIQSHWRGCMARRCVHLLAQRRSAAVALQRAFRVRQSRHMLRTLQRLHALRMALCARRIQRAWRRWKETRGWQLGTLREARNSGSQGVLGPCASGTKAGASPKRMSEGDLASRPLRFRGNADARLAGVATGAESMTGSDPAATTDAPRLRRAMSATRERSGALQAEEQAKKRQLGERIVMTSSKHRTDAQALAVATQRSMQPRQKQLAKHSKALSVPVR